MLIDGTNEPLDNLDYKLFRLQGAAKQLVTLMVAANVTMPLNVEIAWADVSNILNEFELAKPANERKIITNVSDDKPDVPF